MIFKHMCIYKNIYNLIYFYESLKIFASIRLVFQLMSEFDNFKFSEKGDDEEDNVEDQ